MAKAISAAYANRNFFKLLREVREGHSYVVTSDARPIAKIIPATSDAKFEGSGRAALIARLRSEPVLDVGPWNRGELNEDAS